MTAKLRFGYFTTGLILLFAADPAATLALAAIATGVWLLTRFLAAVGGSA